MSLTAKILKPRNPFVASSLRRKAGPHRRGSGSRRRLAEGALRRELRELGVNPSC